MTPVIKSTGAGAVDNAFSILYLVAIESVSVFFGQYTTRKVTTGSSSAYRAYKEAPLTVKYSSVLVEE